LTPSEYDKYKALQSKHSLKTVNSPSYQIRPQMLGLLHPKERIKGWR